MKFEIEKVFKFQIAVVLSIKIPIGNTVYFGDD